MVPAQTQIGSLPVGNKIKTKRNHTQGLLLHAEVFGLKSARDRPASLPVHELGINRDRTTEFKLLKARNLGPEGQIEPARAEP